jgi:hypothetical protein
MQSVGPDSNCAQTRRQMYLAGIGRTRAVLTARRYDVPILLLGEVIKMVGNAQRSDDSLGIRQPQLGTYWLTPIGNESAKDSEDHPEIG